MIEKHKTSSVNRTNHTQSNVESVCTRRALCPFPRLIVMVICVMFTTKYRGTLNVVNVIIFLLKHSKCWYDDKSNRFVNYYYRFIEINYYMIIWLWKHFLKVGPCARYFCKKTRFSGLYFSALPNASLGWNHKFMEWNVILCSQLVSSMVWS